jgi:sensor histidine kinase YesM
MELIQSYLAIEQVRFSERLAVEYDIDEECNILIPGLILQPIVENAVKHGLAPKKEGGKIKISVKKEGENVVIRITDNGVGMDIKKLPDIMGGERGGIGLGNTNERLKRYYNTQIKAVSRPGEGTEVTIVIPMNRSKKHE